LSPYTSGQLTFFITAQITLSIALEGPLHLKPLEQNDWLLNNNINQMCGFCVHV